MWSGAIRRWQAQMGSKRPISVEGSQTSGLGDSLRVLFQRTGQKRTALYELHRTAFLPPLLPLLLLPRQLLFLSLSFPFSRSSQSRHRTNADGMPLTNRHTSPLSQHQHPGPNVRPLDPEVGTSPLVAGQGREHRRGSDASIIDANVSQFRHHSQIPSKRTHRQLLGSKQSSPTAGNSRESKQDQ